MTSWRMPSCLVHVADEDKSVWTYVSRGALTNDSSQEYPIPKPHEKARHKTRPVCLHDETAACKYLPGLDKTATRLIGKSHPLTTATSCSELPLSVPARLSTGDSFFCTLSTHGFFVCGPRVAGVVAPAWQAVSPWRGVVVSMTPAWELSTHSSHLAAAVEIWF